MKSLPLPTFTWQQVSVDAQGLVPVIIQDAASGIVLMLGYMNQTAYQLTITTRQVHFWSRSRNCLWRKGETSGSILAVQSIAIDCDADTILIQVQPAGPVCHTGAQSCFYTITYQADIP